jgi:hypothetical protein
MKYGAWVCELFLLLVCGLILWPFFALKQWLERR